MIYCNPHSPTVQIFILIISVFGPVVKATVSTKLCGTIFLRPFAKRSCIRMCLLAFCFVSEELS